MGGGGGDAYVQLFDTYLQPLSQDLMLQSKQLRAKKQGDVYDPEALWVDPKTPPELTDRLQNLFAGLIESKVHFLYPSQNPPSDFNFVEDKKTGMTVLNINSEWWTRPENAHPLRIEREMLKKAIFLVSRDLALKYKQDKCSEIAHQLIVNREKIEFRKYAEEMVARITAHPELLAPPDGTASDAATEAAKLEVATPDGRKILARKIKENLDALHIEFTPGNSSDDDENQLRTILHDANADPQTGKKLLFATTWPLGSKNDPSSQSPATITISFSGWEFLRTANNPHSKVSDIEVYTLHELIWAATRPVSRSEEQDFWFAISSLYENRLHKMMNDGTVPLDPMSDWTLEDVKGLFDYAENKRTYVPEQQGEQSWKLILKFDLKHLERLSQYVKTKVSTFETSGKNTDLWVKPDDIAVSTHNGKKDVPLGLHFVTDQSQSGNFQYSFLLNGVQVQDPNPIMDLGNHDGLGYSFKNIGPMQDSQELFYNCVQIFVPLSHSDSSKPSPALICKIFLVLGSPPALMPTPWDFQIFVPGTVTR